MPRNEEIKKKANEYRVVLSWSKIYNAEKGIAAIEGMEHIEIRVLDRMEDGRSMWVAAADQSCRCDLGILSNILPVHRMPRRLLQGPGAQNDRFRSCRCR